MDVHGVGEPHVETREMSEMVVLVVLLVLALVFGVGAVVKSLFWLFVIAVVLLIAAGWFGARALRSGSH